MTAAELAALIDAEASDRYGGLRKIRFGFGWAPTHPNFSGRALRRDLHANAAVQALLASGHLLAPLSSTASISARGRAALAIARAEPEGWR